MVVVVVTWISVQVWSRRRAAVGESTEAISEPVQEMERLQYENGAADARPSPAMWGDMRNGRQRLRFGVNLDLLVRN